MAQNAVFLAAVLFLSLPLCSYAQFDTLFTYSDSSCEDVKWISVRDGSQCRTSVDPKFYGWYETSSCGTLSGLYYVVQVNIYDNAFCQGPPSSTYQRPLAAPYYCTAAEDGSGNYVRETCSSSLSSFGLQLITKYYSNAGCLTSPVGYNYTAFCEYDGSYVDPENCSPFNNVLYSREVVCTPSAAAAAMAPIFLLTTFAVAFGFSLVM
jgi:hypothetical protein